MTTITTLDQVTTEQINRCERIIDCATGRAFYLVQSENYDENYTEYKVESIRVNDKWFVTCTCPALGNCKHKRWAMAAARVEKFGKRTEARATTWKEDVATLVVNGEQADELTTRRVMAAPAKEVDRKAKPLTNNKPFSLMR